MSTPAQTPSDSSTSIPRRRLRGRLGLVLCVLAFLPALLAKLLPAFWAALPGAARWSVYGVSGLCVIGITLLIMTAEYDDHSTGAAERDR
jgi:hypothetical protein